MILIDTHVLIWLLLKPEKLGAKALDLLREATVSEAITVAAISAWEISMSVDRGRLNLAMPTDVWIERALEQPGLRLAKLDAAIAVDAGQLPGSIHGDPADRIIIATARALGCPVMTADRKILNYAAAGHVQAIDSRR